jgi:DnaJ family protein C protein 17
MPQWQLLERGRDVLSNPAARDVYDSMRSAALIREQQRQAMNTKRRTMIEDLEARERGDTPKRMKHDQANGMSEAERKLMAARGQKRAEERQRLMEEAEERMRKVEEAKPQAQPHLQRQSGSVDHAPEKTTVEAGEGDPYETEIAKLERSLREVQERKKASKKMRKSDVRLPSSLDATSQAQATPTQPPHVSGSKADERKKVFLFSTPKSTATETSAPPAKGDFSATMARLRAAQAEKDKIKAAGAAAAVSQGETI